MLRLVQLSHSHIGQVISVTVTSVTVTSVTVTSVTITSITVTLMKQGVLPFAQLDFAQLHLSLGLQPISEISQKLRCSNAPVD